jgi:RimJ/RimL family protein N-acetyltransferase
MDTFTGPPVYLRPLDRGHLPACLRWFHEDSDVVSFLNWDLPLNNAVTEERWLETMQASADHHVFAIVESGGDEHVGTIGIHGIDTQSRKGTMGVYISAPWRGRGLGQAAIAKLLQWCFQVRNLHRVELSVWSYNVRAIHCYEALGFRREGVLRDGHFMDGRYWDEEIWGLLEGEFRAGARRRVTAEGSG